MEKFDLKKQYPSYFSAKTIPEVVTIESAQFLSLTGKGDPSSDDFMKKISALYSCAYTVKFRYKDQGKDFVVPKLEGLWWFNNRIHRDLSFSEIPKIVPREEWEYRLLIRMPEYVTAKEVEQGRAVAFDKKKLEYIQDVGLFQMNEGKSVQILHVGPYSTEFKSLEKMQTLIEKEGFTKNGLHHEIYLSDFNKTEPGKLKTILRTPVK